MSENSKKQIISVPINQIEPGPIRHPELSDELITRIKAFREILAEHDTTSLDHCIDNFRRDHSPEKEIRHWEMIANVYKKELALRPQADATERDLLYKMIFQLSLYPLEYLLPLLPSEEALPNQMRVLKHYYEEWDNSKMMIEYDKKWEQK